MIKLAAVAGPTASGKTALAVELAKRLFGEVVSFDSMQLYSGVSIGTAKPDAAEMQDIPHHMFDLVPPDGEFSCADFCDAARPVIAEIAGRGRLPILCGGTGLYLDSLLSGPGLSAAGADADLRDELSKLAADEGAESLHKRLAAIDPDSAAAIHPNNVKRVIRAIEIYELTGITKSEWDRKSREITPEYDAAVVVIAFRDRELLYERIERRVDAMLDAGLEAEAESLYAAGLLSTGKGVAQAIGYKEFIPYFKGECSISDVRDAIVLATRHYAKRQITWFSAKGERIVIYADDGGKVRDIASIADEAESKIKERLRF